MTISAFNHVQVSGIKTVIPQSYVDIDDELQYFDNNPKKLARAKKMMGYGRRYLVDELTTVTDLAVDAAEKLLVELKIDRDDIASLIFVNQSPDYPEPCDACIAHSRLQLSEGCACFSVSLGCSGYAYGLWLAHSLIASGAVKNCLLLAGDVSTRKFEQSNRKVAPVFGDAASASFLQYTDQDLKSYFVLGSRGNGWNKIVMPLGGIRIPHREDTISMRVTDTIGNEWNGRSAILKGEDVFNFTMDVAPQLIKDTMTAANWSANDVDLFAIHQANKQIVENIIFKASIPAEKAPSDVFSKYANNSTNSVVTVLCDQVKPLNKTVLCTFGIGLSWGGVAIDLSCCYNGKISTYTPPKNRPTREEQIADWINYFKGE